MNKKLISVIIPAYNEEKTIIATIKETIEVINNIKELDYEIIIVDDRSSNGTYDYLRTNEGQFKHVTFVNVKALPDHFTAKKYAVTMGIKKAQKELLASAK